MAGRASKAQKILDGMVARTELSPQGRDWLISAVDPFHDLNLKNFDGYPDQQVGKSVVSRVQRQVTIRKPAATAAQWQFQLATYPMTYGSGGDVGQLTMNNNAFTPTGLGNQEIAPVTIYIADDGSDIGPFESGTSATKYILSIPEEYTSGPFRVVGWGVEVTDTTADIYKQGSVTVYKQNSPTIVPETGTFFDPAPATTHAAFSYQKWRRHPKNLSEASLLPGTLNWRAEDGCYLVMTMNGPNPAKCADSTQFIIAPLDASTGATVDFQAVLGPALLGGAGGQQWMNVRWGLQPYHLSGAMFTGLNEFSSFLVVVNWYVERFPTPDEESIVNMAKPSACFDPFALEFYDRMLTAMPVGVPVAENGLGEWFDDVVHQVSKYVSPIARAFGGPIGNTIAGVSDSLHNVSGESRRKRKMKRRLQNQSHPPPGPSVRNLQNRKKFVQRDHVQITTNLTKAQTAALLQRGRAPAYPGPVKKKPYRAPQPSRK